MAECQLDEACRMEIEQWTLTFRYQMLDRLRTDCNYYLGYGRRCSRYLWAGDVAEQIAYMRAIWDSFSQDQKPEWLSMLQIDDYEARMMGMDQITEQRGNEYVSVARHQEDLGTGRFG